MFNIYKRAILRYYLMLRGRINMAGKLTNLEKYAIQGMINDDKSLAEICKAVGKPAKVINMYLEKLSADIGKTKLVIDTSEIKEMGEKLQEKVEEAVEEYVPNQLREYKEKLEAEKARVVSAVPEGLAKKFIPNKSAGGREGIAVMSEAASMMGDDAKKSMKLTNRSRTAKGNIYNIKENKID